MKTGKISAVIITKNEERNIERCLVSLQNVVDEIIVVDAFSSDMTEAICKHYGVIFQKVDWQGYSFAKNFGNNLAQFPYILSIDADEALSDELKESILNAKKNLSGVYNFNRLLNYCGQWIWHCGWYPGRKVRLFPKEGSQWNDEKVHEKLKFAPTKTTNLQGNLLHYSYYSIQEHILRCNTYTDISFEKYINQSKSFLIFKMLLSPIFRFFVSYFLKLGVLDGMNGFFICFMQSFDVFLKYQKAIQKQKITALHPTIQPQIFQEIHDLVSI